MPALNHEALWAYIEKTRAKKPLVHSITNYVVMNTTANSLLAFGASPVMAHALEEVEEITSIASALVLNIGTLSSEWIKAMEKAQAVAFKRKIPIVLDPVGAGASKLRTDTALQLLSASENILLRANASEIMALAGVKIRTRGVDSSAEVPEAVNGAKKLAKEYKCTVCISGPVDFITDGEKNIFIKGGHHLMPLITGMGCTASALAGALATAVEDNNYLKSLSAVMVLMSAAGKKASEKAQGPGSFWWKFLDALYLIQKEDLNSVSISTAPFNE